MQKKMRAVSKITGYDALMVIVIGHGGEDCFVCHDGCLLDTIEIKHSICSPYWGDKPKLFVLDTCNERFPTKTISNNLGGGENINQFVWWRSCCKTQRAYELVFTKRLIENMVAMFEVAGGKISRKALWDAIFLDFEKKNNDQQPMSEFTCGNDFIFEPLQGGMSYEVKCCSVLGCRRGNAYDLDSQTYLEVCTIHRRRLPSQPTGHGHMPPSGYGPLPGSGYAEVIATHQIGQICIYDPMDPYLNYKLLFPSGLPKADWFHANQVRPLGSSGGGSQDAVPAPFDDSVCWWRMWS